MLLKNYYAVCQMMVKASQQTATSVTLPIAMKNCSGKSITSTSIASSMGFPHFAVRHALWEPIYNGIASQTNNITTDDNRLGYTDILLGTNGTAATENDYKILSQITTGLSCTSAGYTLSEDGKRYTATKTFQNTSEEGMVIKEIGFSVAIPNERILVAREVLAEPLTVEAGKVFNISFTFDF